MHSKHRPYGRDSALMTRWYCGRLCRIETGTRLLPIQGQLSSEEQLFITACAAFITVGPTDLYCYTRVTKCLFQALGSNTAFLLGQKTVLLQTAATIHNHRGQIKKIQPSLISGSLTNQNNLPLVLRHEHPWLNVIKWVCFILFLLIE